MIAAAAPASGRPALPQWAATAIAFGVVLVAWQIIGMTFFQETSSIPPPTDIIHSIRDDPSFYWRNLSATLHAAAQGWVWGNALAITFAFLVLVLPAVERPLIQLGITSYCLPAVAIGPIFAIVFSGDTASVVLAGLAVFFTTLVGALVGLRSADPTTLDVVHAYGGGRRKKLTKVRLRASLPSLFAGLRVAAPAAVLGAIIGEYSGADHGIGVAMIAAQQRLDGPTTWALALVATAAAAAVYGLTALVGRWLTPWAPRGGA
jgi:ABC-type nitrate/sulfonate/bicarbonate transport system permease component